MHFLRSASLPASITVHFCPHTHPALNAEPFGDFPGDFTESPGADMTSCTPRYVNFSVLRPMRTAAGHHAAVLAAKTGPECEGSDPGICGFPNSPNPRPWET